MPKIKNAFKFWTCFAIFIIFSLSLFYAHLPAEDTTLKDYVVREGDKGDLIYHRLANNKYLRDEFHYEVERLSGIKSIGDIYPGQHLILPQKMLKANSLPTVRQRELASRSEGGTLVLEATGYTHTGNQTFTETWPKTGTIAVDPKVIPLGTKLYIDGYGLGVAEDTGRLIKGRIIDLFFNTEREATNWGRRKVRVRVVE